MMVKVLVVDDEYLLRESVARLLRTRGYRVAQAENGEDAWEHLLADDDGIELVVTDNDMPELKGIQLLRRMRADPRFKDLPVVLQSGGDSAKSEAIALKAAFRDKLTPARTLFEAIESVLPANRRPRTE
jgi:two-component system chemotaxis response regulator CheY